MGRLIQWRKVILAFCSCDQSDMLKVWSDDVEQPSTNQIDTALVEIERITRECAQQVDELIFYFGHLDHNDPERQVLAAKVSQILRAWSGLVTSYGAHPQDLWTVTFPTASGDIQWQYPCSRLSSPF